MNRGCRTSRKIMNEIIAAVKDKRPDVPHLDKNQEKNLSWVVKYHKDGWTNLMISLGMGYSRSWVCNMVKMAKERGLI